MRSNDIIIATRVIQTHNCTQDEESFMAIKDTWVSDVLRQLWTPGCQALKYQSSTTEWAIVVKKTDVAIHIALQKHIYQVY